MAIQLHQMKKAVAMVVAVVMSLYLFSAYSEEGSVDNLRRLLEQHVHHKDLFPMDNRDIAGTSLVVGGLLVAAAGGIGGGGILVPLLILVYGFSPKFAIPLSNFTIVGSSITNMVMNLSKRHPTANRPLVDWDLILVMEPLTMAGAIVGAFISKVMPDYILVISLVFLLAFTTNKTLKKGLQQFKKETEQFEQQAKSELQKAVEHEIEISESQSLLGNNDDDEEEEEEDAEKKKGNKNVGKNKKGSKKDEHTTDVEAPVSSAPAIVAREEEMDPELAALLEEESKTPYDKVAIVTTMILVVIVLNLLKGGGAAFPSPLGIECGSNGYWTLTAMVFVWVIGISLWMRNVVIEKWRLKTRLRYKYAEGDVEWTPRNTLVYPALCFFAGFFAGMFGVGGGIVKGPLMLHMGIHPLVASGTVAVMIMFTSVAATTMFMAFGTLTWDYAWFLFVLGLLATFFGQYGVSYLVEKYQRYSLVSFSIGAVVAISTVLMSVQSVFTLMDTENNDSNALCKN